MVTLPHCHQNSVRSHTRGTVALQAVGLTMTRPRAEKKPTQPEPEIAAKLSTARVVATDFLVAVSGSWRG
jgi:hypothetical protein